MNPQSELVPLRVSGSSSNTLSTSVTKNTTTKPSAVPSIDADEDIDDGDAQTCHQVPQLTFPQIVAPWIVEIVWYCISVAVIIAIVVIMKTYDGAVNPEWQGGITLNTLVSFGSVFFRISIMVPVASCTSQHVWIWLAGGRRRLYDIVYMDRASRSPWGSLLLLFRHHMQSFAFIGSMVTILSLGIGPFFQQCIVLYTKPILKADAEAFASLAHSYNNTALINTYESVLDTGSSTPPNMRTAIFNGFYSSGELNRPLPLYYCPSSACEWDPFYTLGVGVACVDTSDLFRLDCGLNVTTRPYDWSSSDPCTLRSDNTSKHLFSPRRLGDNYFGKPFYFAGQFVNELTEESFSQTVPGLPWFPEGSFTDIQWLRVFNFTTKSWKYGFQYQVGPNSTIESTMCRFYTSIQKVAARVTGEGYTENLLNESSAGVLFNESYVYTMTNETGAATTLTIDRSDQEVLLRTILEPVTSSDQVYNNDNNQYSYWSVYGNISFATGPTENTDGAAIIKTLYRTRDLQDIAQSIAEHVNVALRSVHTFHLRAQKGAGANISALQFAPEERVLGRVYEDKIHVRVRWAWIILPAILSVLVLALLIATIVLSAHTRVGVWKDNALALLFFSRWQNKDGPDLVPVRTEDELHQLAKGMRVNISYGAEGVQSGIKGVIYLDQNVEALEKEEPRKGLRFRKRHSMKSS